MRKTDSFHIMAKPSGAICNLDCTYCFYLEKEKLYPASQNYRMNDEVLESFIKQYIESQNVPQISFAWQGGEPTLLGVDYFRKVVNLQEKYSNGKKIFNAFQTNGILLNDEWCEFFSQNNFLIGLSIDGPKYIHDKYRPFKGNQPSFNRVSEGLEYLKKHNVEFNTLTCVSRINQDKGTEVYNFLKEIGSKYLQFIPIVERISLDQNESLKLVKPDYNNAVLSEWSVDALAYGNFIIEIFDNWVRNDVGNIYVQMFDVALESWYGVNQSLCVFNETCGAALALEHNGDLYSCDHYVYPENKLGNIMDNNLSKSVDSETQNKFGLDKKHALPKYCLECEVRFACNGECPKHRFLQTPDGDPGLNYLCAAYKKFFSHIDPYMKFMSNELHQKRPPSNVIKWANEKDKGFPKSGGSGRNDPCPCGSGVKLKNCCGK